MSRWLAVGLIAFVSLALLAQAPPGDTLDIYWVDVEGGAATLIVTPARQSVLMDAGWARPDARDAERIQAAMGDAGIDHIDYFLTSHFHGDHVGGLTALARRVDIGQFVDHGDSVEQDSPRGQALWEGYLAVAAGNRRSVAPGDKLPLRRLEFTFVAGHRRTLERPLEPLGPNPFCDQASPGEADMGENGHSLGYLMSLGAFQFLNLGDLTEDRQYALACPENMLAVVDLFQVPHHGNGVSPALAWAVSPRTAVSNNGPHKGGSADGYDVVARTPSIEDIWQSHRALDAGDAHNTDAGLIANHTDEGDCFGHWIKATIHPDGRSYTVRNGRNGETRTYLSR
jgi:competence protein ComEC